MTSITNDEELIRHSTRARGRVVLITGQIHIRAQDPCDPAADARSHAVLIPLRLQVVLLDRLDTQHGSSQRTGPRFFTFGSRSSAARIQFSSLSPCFSCRANVVIGDIFSPGAQDIVDTINKLPPGSGKACWRRCDVTNWEDQIALYELAMTRFGGVDIVVSASFLDVHRWAR